MLAGMFESPTSVLPTTQKLSNSKTPNKNPKKPNHHKHTNFHSSFLSPSMALHSIYSSYPLTSLALPRNYANFSSLQLQDSPRSLRHSNSLVLVASSSEQVGKWRVGVSSFSSFLPSFITGMKDNNSKNAEPLKEELLATIAPLDRGAKASPEDQQQVEQIAKQLEAVNSVKEPLKSDLLNGKWELIYTTSRSILQTQRPKFLRPNGKIYQAINADTLRAQNMETWPYFNQVTANLVPLNARRVAVRFDTFKIFGLIPIKAPGRGKGELEITYLDEELRVSRGDKGNLFVLKMVDPTYRVPL